MSKVAWRHLSKTLFVKNGSTVYKDGDIFLSIIENNVSLSLFRRALDDDQNEISICKEKRHFYNFYVVSVQKIVIEPNEKYIQSNMYTTTNNTLGT